MQKNLLYNKHKQVFSASNISMPLIKEFYFPHIFSAIRKEFDFHMQEEAPGQVFWHANGWTIYTVLQDYMRRMQRAPFQA